MEELNVAFLLTPYKERAFDTISIPLGLAWLNSFIKAKDPSIKIYNFDLLLEPEREDEFYSLVRTGAYDVVGIQAHSNATAHEAVRISKRVKEIDSKIIIILGGNAATFCSEFFLNSGSVDIISYGEGEFTLLELLQEIKKGEYEFSKIKGISYLENGTIVKTGARELIQNLDEIPLPDRDAFNWMKYPQWSLMTSRGCPYSCTFCSSTKFWGNGIRFRSSENVFQEIQQLVEKYKVKRIYILDDTFGANYEDTVRLMNKIISSDFDLEWACLTRAEVVSPEILDLFKRAGCVQVHFGLETANLDTQNLINKRLNIPQLERMLNYCKNIQLRTKLSVIFGLPNETSKHVLNTIEFLKKMQPDEIQIYPLMPYVGIDILNGKNIRELKKGKHFWKQDALVPLTESKSLPTEEQLRLTQYAIEEFKILGYKWIPMDISPDKHNEDKIIKTVFAPIQGLKK